MTKYAKTLIKASVLSLALVGSTIALDVFRKSDNTMETAFAGFSEFVVGMFALVALVGTLWKRVSLPWMFGARVESLPHSGQGVRDSSSYIFCPLFIDLV